MLLYILIFLDYTDFVTIIEVNDEKYIYAIPRLLLNL